MVTKVQKKILSFFIVLVGAGVLSGCAQLRALPDEERYQFINQVKDDLDYSSAGNIVSERYDEGDGVFSPSFFLANVEGPGAFSILQQRVQSLPGAECQLVRDTQTRCQVGQIDVSIYRNESKMNMVTLNITDAYNGRDSNADK